MNDVDKRFDEKVCTRCRLSKPRGDFNKQSRLKDGLQPHCRTCQAEHKALIKAEVLAHYGRGGEAKCNCCGESNLHFLTIDHVAGGGLRERWKVGFGYNVYYSLKARNYPPGLQTLCLNCHHAKTFYSSCSPDNHQEIYRAEQAERKIWMDAEKLALRNQAKEIIDSIPEEYAVDGSVSKFSIKQQLRQKYLSE